MKKQSLGLALLSSLIFTACGGGGGSSSGNIISSKATDIEVERGKVYSALVKDSKGNIAQQKANTNIYTFANTPAYPITVSGGWIDIDGDGQKTNSDINLKYEMKSYSNIVTPITTYIADENEEKRNEKLKKLLEQVNSLDGENITKEDLLKTASKSSKKAQMLINAVYAESIENSSYENIKIDEVLVRVNDFANITMNDNLSLEQSAIEYEKYLIEQSDIKDMFNNQKLDNTDIKKYTLPILNTKGIKKDSKSIVIINDFPILAIDELVKVWDSYKGLTLYRGENNTTCENNFSGFKYCETKSINDYVNLPNTGEKISLIGVYDIPNYVEDTSDASIEELKGRTFYSIDKSDPNLIEYSKFKIANEFTVNALKESSKDEEYYNLINGKWVKSNSYEDDKSEITKVEVKDKSLKTTLNIVDEGKNYTAESIVSIVKKTSEYYSMKIELIVNGKTSVSYKKWYLQATEEIKNPSLLIK